jgi:DNA-binding GntR family transcriptional regulator
VSKFPIPVVNDLAERPIARPSGLAEEVYRRIRADIMSLRLPPESRVSVDSLARELGVSQTPIREALSMLEANGLVSKRHFAGYATTPRMDRAQLDELFEFRLLIEPHAARKAAEMMGDADMALLASGETAPSHDAFADMDTDFHRLIAQGAGNHLIAESLARLHIHVHIFRSCFRREITEEAVDEHDAIITAIRARDGAHAEAAMRRHIERSYGRLRDFIKE